MGEDQPRQHRVECRPQPPQRLGGEVAGLHPRRGNMVNQHILPGGINHFPEGEDRRRDPPRPQAGAREHKAHKADHKADGAEGHQRADISRAQPPANRVLQSNHHRGVDRQHHGHHFLGEIAAGDHQHILRETGGEGAADEGGQQPGAGKPQQRPVAQQHRRRPGRGARLGRGGAIPLKKQLNKHQRKGGAGGRQPERQIDTVHYQQGADGRPNGPADVKDGVVQREDARFFLCRQPVGEPGFQDGGKAVLR